MQKIMNGMSRSLTDWLRQITRYMKRSLIHSRSRKPAMIREWIPLLIQSRSRKPTVTREWTDTDLLNDGVGLSLFEWIKLAMIAFRKLVHYVNFGNLSPGICKFKFVLHALLNMNRILEDELQNMLTICEALLSRRERLCTGGVGLASLACLAIHSPRFYSYSITHAKQISIYKCQVKDYRSLRNGLVV